MIAPPVGTMPIMTNPAPQMVPVMMPPGQPLDPSYGTGKGGYDPNLVIGAPIDPY